MGSVARTLIITACVVVVTVQAAPQTKINSDRIFFPDQLDELNQAIASQCVQGRCSTSTTNAPLCQGNVGPHTMLVDVVNVRTRPGACNFLAGQVLWPRTGQCVQLLTQGPCPPGHWVKLSKPGMVPVCGPVQCGVGQATQQGGQCGSVAVTTRQGTCPPTQVLLTNEFGEAECECKPGEVYFAATDSCYPSYTQGPCQNGQMIKVIDEGERGRASCVPNPCSAPNTAMVDSQCTLQTRAGHDTKCYPLDTQGPCSDGSVFVRDSTLSEPLCVTTHSILNLPNVFRCPRGSIKDFNGRCRRNFARDVSSSPTTFTTSPVRPRPDGRQCPPGESFFGGFCVRRSSGR